MRKATPPISDDGNGNKRLLSTSRSVISTKTPVEEPSQPGIIDDRVMLKDIITEAWSCRLGNRSAREPVLDQFKEK